MGEGLLAQFGRGFHDPAQTFLDIGLSYRERIGESVSDQSVERKGVVLFCKEMQDLRARVNHGKLSPERRTLVDIETVLWGEIKEQFQITDGEIEQTRLPGVTGTGRPTARAIARPSF